MCTPSAIHLAEEHQLLGSLQISGKPKGSAVDIVIFQVTKIDQVNRKHHIISTLCIDMNRAFENIYKQRLLHILWRMRQHSNVIRWVNTFLSERLASLLIPI
jgi:hypothetical protein